jgi:protein-disulfide isomerase
VIIGKAEAPHTIVKFTDLQCPFCHRFYPPVKELLSQYPNDVKLVIKHFPLGFHPNARPAAKVALAANAQGKYEGMIDLLLENGADASEAKLREYSQTLGINADQLIKDLRDNDAAYEAIISADEALAGQVDVRGTPTFFLDGKKTDARSPEQWKSAIEDLKK